MDCWRYRNSCWTCANAAAVGRDWINARFYSDWRSAAVWRPARLSLRTWAEATAINSSEHRPNVGGGKPPPTQALPLRPRQSLDGHVSLDAWVRVVADDFKVFELVVVDRRRFALDHQLRQLLRRTRQLGADLFHVVAVRVGVAGGDDDLVRDQVALLGQHVGQQRQRGGVVWQAEEDVGAADVQLHR